MSSWKAKGGSLYIIYLMQKQSSLCAFTYHFNKLKELYDGRVEEVVSGPIVQQGINDRLKQVPFDDVAVVVFVF